MGTSISPTNDSTIWHLTQLSGTSLLNAEYNSHQFAPHYHEELSIGVIQKGKLNVQIGKHRRMTLTPGDIVIINPGEIHEGLTEGSEGYFYRMFYLPPWLLGKATGVNQDYYPHFANCAISDFAAAKQLSWLHRSLMSPSVSALEFETQLLEVINNLIGHYADAVRMSTPKVDLDEGAIRQAQAFLAAHFDEKVSLEHLSAQVGLTPFHFLRAFKATIGMTPHAFQMQLRIDRAKGQLLSGEPIATIAAGLGFHDQSHLTKQFKAVVGVTPQRFRLNSLH